MHGYIPKIYIGAVTHTSKRYSKKKNVSLKYPMSQLRNNKAKTDQSRGESNKKSRWIVFEEEVLSYTDQSIRRQKLIM